MSLEGSRKFLTVENIRDVWKLYKKKKFIKYGLPFIIFVVGGSYGLREWTQIRYQFSQVKGVSKDEAEKMGLHREKNVTLEGAFEEIKKLDIDNWENKRGPRPWEQNETEIKK